MNLKATLIISSYWILALFSRRLEQFVDIDPLSSYRIPARWLGESHGEREKQEF
jgi:hypothetical protein